MDAPLALTGTVRYAFHNPDVEKEYEETESRLMDLSTELVSLNCDMMIHMQVRII